jgi:hypothetical protein
VVESHEALENVVLDLLVLRELRPMRIDGARFASNSESERILRLRNHGRRNR